MNVRLKVEKPETIEFTMAITMSAGEWEQLRDQLMASKNEDLYPSWTVIRQINDLLAQARRIFWPATEPGVEE